MKMKYPFEYYLTVSIWFGASLLIFIMGLQMINEGIAENNRYDIIVGISVMIGSMLTLLFTRKYVVSWRKKLDKLLEIFNDKEIVSHILALYEDIRFLKKEYPDDFKQHIEKLLETMEGLP